MKVVGLVSGGKDSICNLMECVRNGHTIVAIANLRPADELKGKPTMIFSFKLLGTCDSFSNPNGRIGDCDEIPKLYT